MRQPEPAATADTHADMTFTEESLPGTSEDETALRPTSAEDGAMPTSSTSDGAATSILMNPRLLWLIIAIMSVALILILLKDKLRAWYRPTSLDAQQEPPEAGTTPPALTAEQEHGLKMFNGLKRRWKQYFVNIGRNDQLTLESLFLFFDTADTNRVLAGQHEKRANELQAKVDQLSVAKTALPIEDPRISELERQLREATSAKADAEAAKLVAEGAKSTAEAATLRLGLEHSTALRKKDEEHAVTKTALEMLQKEFEAFKAKGLGLLETFYQEGVANLDLALDHASRSGENSTPSFVTVIDRVSYARDLFNVMVRGVLNDLMIHFDSDLAMVPAAAGSVSIGVPGSTDSWLGALDESVPELSGERTSHGALIPGFGGVPDLVSEPASVPPASSDMSIPSAEALALKGESTNPGIPAPAPSPVAESSPEDNVGFRMSQHAPPAPPERSNGKRRKRDRKTTDSFERAPVAQAIEERRSDEKTAVIDQAALEHKKLEARTGKTISPGMTAAARDDSPIPGSLVPPPPPIVTLDASNGEEPDSSETEIAPRPASLSIFDDLPGSAGETGVTVKRAIGKD
jgi:hypothetical protein